MTEQRSSTVTAGLLPCPFCGNASELSAAFDGSIYEGYVVICASGKCGCQSGVFPTKPMAIRCWNTRATAQGPSEAWPPRLPLDILNLVHDGIKNEKTSPEITDGIMNLILAGKYGIDLETLPAVTSTNRESQP